MKKHSIISLVFFLASLAISQAQLTSVKSEFQAINEHYLSLSKVSMSLSFKVYVENSKTPTDISTGYYRLNNGKFSMKYFGMEMIVSNAKTLLIQDESRYVYLDTLHGEIQAEPKALPETFMDSLFLMYKDVFTTQISPQIKKYTFIYDGGTYSKAEIYVNVETKFITKIVSYPVEKYEVSEGLYKNVRSEIEFSNINTNPTFVNEFDLGRYVTRVNGVYQLVPRYSNYTLINML